jgi:hypothetical protein
MENAKILKIRFCAYCTKAIARATLTQDIGKGGSADQWSDSDQTNKGGLRLRLISLRPTKKTRRNPRLIEITRVSNFPLYLREVVDRFP